MKIGLELEFPMVNNQGDPATYQDTLWLWEAWGKQGWTQKRDTATKKLVGVYKKTDTGVLSIDTDYGACTLEVGLPPQKTIQAVREAWNTFLHTELLAMLERRGLFILAYADQPKEAHLEQYIAPKAHYHILGKSIVEKEPHEWVLNNWPGVAAVQFNIDIPLKDVVTVTNTLFTLTPLMVAWSVNSPVIKNTVQTRLSNRMYGYIDVYEQVALTKGRASFPERPYEDVSDVVNRRWGFPIFEIIRDGIPYYPVDRTKTTWDFIEEGMLAFYDIEGNRHEYTVQAQDLQMGLYINWLLIKIKLFFDGTKSVADIVSAIKDKRPFDVLTDTCYIEVRAIGTQKEEEMFAWLALTVGWINTIGAIQEITQQWRMADLRALMPAILVDGLKTGWKGKTLSEWGEKFLAIGKAGLTLYDETLLPLLVPLEKRLHTGRSPAHDIIDVFKKDGLEGLLGYTTIE